MKKLGRTLDAFIRSTRGSGLPAWILDRIDEIAEFDPTSTAFRYGEIYDKQLKTNVPVDGEIYVSLIHLQRSMAALKRSLLGLGEVDEVFLL